MNDQPNAYWPTAADAKGVTGADLNLGGGDFTVSAWIETDGMAGGDIVACFDAEHRTGFNLALNSNPGAPSNQPNRGNLTFGVDCGTEPIWEHCGRPGNSRFIYALGCHNGDLYAATHETNRDDRGHVFRHAGGQAWTDCGAPDSRNSVCSIASFEGDLYAATMCNDMDGSLQPISRNMTPGGSVCRYLGGEDWEDCGAPFPNGFTALYVYREALYARNTYHPHWYRYEGNGQWATLETPNVGFFGCAEFHDQLYAAPKKLKSNIYPDAAHPNPYAWCWRHTPDNGWARSSNGLSGQVYAFTYHNGELIAGTWPRGEVFRSADGENWTNAGACGLAPLEGKMKSEIMAMATYNGKLYAGTLPLGQVFRYDGDGRWPLVKRIDSTEGAPIRRVWSVAEHDGQLFWGTLPGGEVHAMRTGAVVSSSKEVTPGRHHVAAVRNGTGLELYLDGRSVAKSERPCQPSLPLDMDAPLTIGTGPTLGFDGRVSEVRIHRHTLTEAEIGALR